MAKAIIKKGKPTQGHGAWLEAQGYTVTEDEKNFNVEVEGFHTDPIDLTETPNALKELIAAHKAITYQTEVTFEKNGEKKTMKGIFLAGQMGEASALMMKSAKEVKAKKAKKPVLAAFQL